MPTHAHAQGYADSNFLIPELVSGVQFRKGPYYAENGDFSSAGSANINYFNVLDRPIVTHHRRLVRLRPLPRRRLSARGQAATCSAAFEWERDNGPWDQPEQQGQVQRRRSATARATRATACRSPSSASATTGTRPTRFRSAPSTAATIDRFGFIEESDGGETYRYAGIFDWQRPAPTTRRASPPPCSATASSCSTTSPTS